MPCVIQIIAQRSECTVASSCSRHIPTITVSNYLKAAVTRRVVVVYGLEEPAQAVTIVELEVAHSVIPVTRAKTLVVILTAFVFAEIQHFITESHGAQRSTSAESADTNFGRVNPLRLRGVIHASIPNFCTIKFRRRVLTSRSHSSIRLSGTILVYRSGTAFGLCCNRGFSSISTLAFSINRSGPRRRRLNRIIYYLLA